MKKTIIILGTLTILALILACSEKSATQPESIDNELIGKWELTYLQLESESGMLGGSPERLDHYIVVEFNEDGTFEQSETAYGSEENYDGFYELNGDTITLSTPGNYYRSVKYSISGQTMKWSFLEDIHGEVFEYNYEFSRID